MQKIRLKGTHTLYSIDYSIIEKEYEAMLENEETPEEDTKVQDENTGEEEMTTDRFLEFCEQRMEYYLGLFSKYKYDGINVIYSGIDPLALSETEKSQLEARQQIFFGKIEAWKNTNVNATFIFEGKPQNLLYDKSLLQKTNFIIIPVVDAVNREDILFTTNMALVEGVPTGRIIYGVTIPSLTDSKDQTGYFEAQENGSPMYAVKGAALAVISNNNNNFVQSFQDETMKKKERMCEIGFWLSILGLVCSFFGIAYGIFVYIMDFYFASQGLKTRKKGKAIATIVLSIISILFIIFTLIIANS